MFVSPPEPQPQLEGNEGSTEYVFTISTATGNNVNEAVSVDWTVTGIEGGAADADGADFVEGTLFSGTVDFEPGGDQQKEISFFAQGDTDPELDEKFRLTLTAIRGNAEIRDGDKSADAFISNDDFAPDLSIGPSPVENDEGDSDTTPFTFTVTRTGTDEDLNETTTVDWTVTPTGTTPASVEDFVSDNFPSGTLTFAPTEKSKDIVIDVQGDTEFEDNEGFTVTLSNQENATISVPTATGTIKNDDPQPPDLSIEPSDASKAEGNEGSSQFTFTVTRKGNNLGEPSTVNWEVTPSGLAPANVDDFVSDTFPSGTLEFPADSQKEDITIEVQGDSEIEPIEEFGVTISAGTNANVTEDTAIGTILDDDAPEGIFGTEDDDVILPSGVSVGVIGGTPSDNDDSINGLGGKDSIDGGGGSDTIDGGAGDDQLIGGAGNDIFLFVGENGDDDIIDFTKGEDRIDLSDYNTHYGAFDIKYDSRDSETEIGEYGARGNQIILVNSLVPLTADDFIFEDGNSIYISDVQLTEGDTGTVTKAVFTVSLSTPVAEPVTVDYATADGTATAGSDYTAVSGTLTFAPGQTVQEVRVPITGDGAVEPNESFFVNLSNPVNDVIADGQGVANILDDDGGNDADEVFDGTDGDDILQGGNGDDSLSGAAGDDALTGGSGDDTIDGEVGDDILAGGSGDDTLDGGGDDDILGGGSGNDVLEGGAGDDALAGGSGDDQLSGGSGNDALIGGSGYDTFVYRTADGDSGQDTIRLFNPDEDTLAFEEYGERLDTFSDLDTNTNGVLDDGDAHVSVDVGNTVIDLGGQTDGESGGTLTLVGVTGLEADDFSFS